MNLDAIYELTPNTTERIAERRMTRIKWSVFEVFCAHPGAVARSHASRLGVEPAALSAILDEFMAAGIIHEPELSRSEYLDQVNLRSPVSKEGEIPVAVVEEISVAVAPERKVSFTLRKSSNRPGAVAAPPIAQAWLIKPLLDFIRDRAGGGSIGQLAVYRAFLKVPQALLKASKLEQLDLDSADLQVSDAALLSAIRRGACEVLGIGEDALPASPESIPAVP